MSLVQMFKFTAAGCNFHVLRQLAKNVLTIALLCFRAFFTIFLVHENFAQPRYNLYICKRLLFLTIFFLLSFVSCSALYAEERLSSQCRDCSPNSPLIRYADSDVGAGSKPALAVNEEELFSSPDTIIETKPLTEEKPQEKNWKNELGVSAEVTAVGEYTKLREPELEKKNRLSSYILGNFFLDARLKKGTKYFANLEVLNNSNSSGTENTEFSLRESFIDFNIKNAVYFRTGKQILQWGRTYLWNPSDLINVEKKTFKKKIGAREGTFGLKIHAPFGTKHNIYGFIDTNKVESSDEIATALKYEFVVNETEMAFSYWFKTGFHSVYSYDASTRFFGIDTLLEAAASYGDNFERIREENGILTKYKEKYTWSPRVSLNLGRQFDFMEINDRISINLEFYYNHSGYTENILNDKIKRDFLLINNLYEPNNLSRYYAALFTTVTKFIISDINFTLNIIRNLNDNSNIASTGLTYIDTINDFNIGLNIYSYLGPEDSEYTISNDTLTAQLTLSIVF